jgi:hypothetical protein
MLGSTVPTVPYIEDPQEGQSPNPRNLDFLLLIQYTVRHFEQRHTACPFFVAPHEGQNLNLPITLTNYLTCLL